MRQRAAQALSIAYPAGSSLRLQSAANETRETPADNPALTDDGKPSRVGLLAKVLQTIRKKPAHAGSLQSITRRAEASAKRIKKFGPRFEPLAASAQAKKSLLEQIQILDSVADNYRDWSRLFLDWQESEGLADTTLVEPLLLQLLDFLDVLFLVGASHADGKKVHAALNDLLPELKSSPHLQERVKKSLLGWSKRAPDLQRDPIVEEAVLCIIAEMLSRRKVLHAANCLLQYIFYLRPGEVDGLEVRQILPPVLHGGLGLQQWALLLSPQDRLNPGKTGERDESLVLDDPEWFWFGDVLRELIASRRPMESVWTFTSDEMVQEFQTSLKNLKMESLGVVRYMLRHAAASNDLLKQKRDRGSVKDRGRWTTDSSLRRYGKPARALRAAHSLPPGLLQYGTQIRSLLPKLFLEGLPVPAIPM